MLFNGWVWTWVPFVLEEKRQITKWKECCRLTQRKTPLKKQMLTLNCFLKFLKNTLEKPWMISKQVSLDLTINQFLCIGSATCATRPSPFSSRSLSRFPSITHPSSNSTRRIATAPVSLPPPPPLSPFDKLRAGLAMTGRPPDQTGKLSVRRGRRAFWPSVLRQAQDARVLKLLSVTLRQAQGERGGMRYGVIATSLRLAPVCALPELLRMNLPWLFFGMFGIAVA